MLLLRLLICIGACAPAVLSQRGASLKGSLTTVVPDSCSSQHQFRIPLTSEAKVWPFSLLPPFKLCIALSSITRCSSVGTLAVLKAELLVKSSILGAALIYSEVVDISKDTEKRCFQLSSCEFAEALKRLNQDVSRFHPAELNIRITVSGFALLAPATDVKATVTLGGSAYSVPVTEFYGIRILAQGPVAFYRSNVACTSSDVLHKCLPTLSVSNLSLQQPAQIVSITAGELDCFPISRLRRPGRRLLLTYFESGDTIGQNSAIVVASGDADVDKTVMKARSVIVNFRDTLKDVPMQCNSTKPTSTEFRFPFPHLESGWLGNGFTPLKVCTTIVGYSPCQSQWPKMTLNLYLTSKFLDLTTSEAALGSEEGFTSMQQKIDGTFFQCRSFSYCEVADALRSLSIQGTPFSLLLTPFLQFVGVVKLQSVMSSTIRSSTVSLTVGGTSILATSNEAKEYSNIKGSLAIVRSDCDSGRCFDSMGDGGPPQQELMYSPQDGKQACRTTPPSLSTASKWNEVFHFSDNAMSEITAYPNFIYPTATPVPPSLPSNYGIRYQDSIANHFIQLLNCAPSTLFFEFKEQFKWTSFMITPLKVCLKLEGLGRCPSRSDEFEVALLFQPGALMTGYKTASLREGVTCFWWSYCELLAALKGVQRNRLSVIQPTLVIRNAGFSAAYASLEIRGTSLMVQAEYLDLFEKVEGPIAVVYACPYSSTAACKLGTQRNLPAVLGLDDHRLQQCDSNANSVNKRYLIDVASEQLNAMGEVEVAVRQNIVQYLSTKIVDNPIISNSGATVGRNCDQLYTFVSEIQAAQEWTDKVVTPLKICGVTSAATQCMLSRSLMLVRSDNYYGELTPLTRFHLVFSTRTGEQVVLYRDSPMEPLGVGDTFSSCTSLSYSEVMNEVALLSTLRVFDISTVILKVTWIVEGLSIPEQKLSVSIAGRSVIVRDPKTLPSGLIFKGPLAVVQPQRQCSAESCGVTLLHGPANDLMENSACRKAAGRRAVTCRVSENSSSASDFVVSFADIHGGFVGQYGNTTHPVKLLFGHEKRMEDRRRKNELRAKIAKQRQEERDRMVLEREAAWSAKKEAMRVEKERLASQKRRDQQAAIAALNFESRKPEREYIEAGDNGGEVGVPTVKVNFILTLGGSAILFTSISF